MINYSIGAIEIQTTACEWDCIRNRFCANKRDKEMLFPFYYFSPDALAIFREGHGNTSTAKLNVLLHFLKSHVKVIFSETFQWGLANEWSRFKYERNTPYFQDPERMQEMFFGSHGFRNEVGFVFNLILKDKEHAAKLAKKQSKATS